MKKTIFSLSLVLLMLGSCAAKDKTLSSNVWDMGQVKSGTVQERTFAFKNEAKKTVTVSSIQTSCGCTGTQIKEKVLIPGHSTDITVRFDSKGYRSGPLEQFIYINTDDTDNPVIKYIVKIEVIG